MSLIYAVQLCPRVKCINAMPSQWAYRSLDARGFAALVGSEDFLFFFVQVVTALIGIDGSGLL